MIKADKALKDFARKMVHLSLDEARRPSPERVGAVLQAITRKPPRQLKTLLKLYLYYIKREIRNSEAVVEYSGAVGENVLREIESIFSARYGRAISALGRETPDLIAGVRVSVGDDVYDASIDGHLKNLAQSVH
jgi:F-type H+-transporting ATPase subunit delta